MTCVLERKTRVRRPLEETFRFFAAPRNLAEITPGWLAFRLLDTGDLEMRRGLRLHYRIRPLGFPQRWTSEITVWDPPHRFVDEQVEGPYRAWRHTHEFRALPDGGTEVRDRVEYELPFGLIGRLAHALLVKHQLRAIFDYRARRIRELLA